MATVIKPIKDKILVINAGSSSIKFQVFQIKDKKPTFNLLAKGLVERIGIKDSVLILEVNENEKFIKHEIKQDIKHHSIGAKLVIDELQAKKIITSFDEVYGLGHRLVHGGEKFKVSTIIDDSVTKQVEELSTLAPLHNPPALKGFNAFHQLAPSIKHVGVFDTSFHTTMPKEKYLYSVPYKWYENYDVRRYGFHGISYRYILEKLSSILNKDKKSINALVCHLGNGASICAIKAGESFNTSMGLTPLDGLIMGTRSGIIDPSIINYICEITKDAKNPQTVQSVTNSLNKESGLLGISMLSSDLRDVIAAKMDEKHQNHEQASLAIKMFVQRIANYIVQYANDLDNNIDALIFTAGIGENSSLVRQWIIDEIKVLNYLLDNKLNEEKYDDFLKISSEKSSIPIYKIRTNEEIMICQDTYQLLSN